MFVTVLFGSLEAGIGYLAYFLQWFGPLKNKHLFFFCCCCCLFLPGSSGRDGSEDMTQSVLYFASLISVDEFIPSVLLLMQSVWVHFRRSVTSVTCLYVPKDILLSLFVPTGGLLLWF
jgi:hypothetical protein